MPSASRPGPRHPSSWCRRSSRGCASGAGHRQPNLMASRSTWFLRCPARCGKRVVTMKAIPQEPVAGSSGISARLQACGIRVTAQRMQIAEALQGRGVEVSKATVYNTLNLFAARGLIRQLAVDDARSWFDSNVQPHYHFHDEATGALTDVALPEVEFSRLPQIPPGMEVASLDLVIRLR